MQNPNHADAVHQTSDSVACTVPGARPSATPDMIAEAAAKLAKRERWDDDQAADVARAWRRHMNGYELAKELESYYGWSINTMDVEALDSMSSEVDDLVRKAGRVWVEENNIQPPLPIGTMTTRGEIVGVYEYDAATYRIRENGETKEGRFLLVKFEDAARADVATSEAA